MKIENLRSPHQQTGGLSYFGRMIDKIRLHAAGALPADYIPNLGGGFDERCVHFLKVSYPALVERVKQGGSEEELLEWSYSQGRKPDAEQIEVWNEFMRKRGWNDSGSPTLQRRKQERGFEKRDEIQTFFDFIDADEERPLQS
jgi:gluconokinase